MQQGAIVLDVRAVEALMTRALRPVQPRLIIPKQAFVARNGAARLRGFATSGWNATTTLLDIEGVAEIQEAYALREAGLTECQAVGLVLARREQARFMGKSCPVLRERGEAHLGPGRILDVAELWPVLGYQ